MLDQTEKGKNPKKSGGGKEGGRKKRESKKGDEKSKGDGQEEESDEEVKGSEVPKPRKKSKKGKSKKGAEEAKGNKKMSDMSPWFRDRENWRKTIKKHRHDLRNAKPVVDDSPPRLNVANIYDVEILRNLRRNLMSAFDLNQIAVKTLHMVNVLPGKTDTFNFNHGKPTSSSYMARKSEAKEIEKQNALLSKAIKLAETRMTTVKEYAEEWKKHEEHMENTSEFPLFWKVKKKEASLEIAPPVPYFVQHVTEKSSKYPDKRPRVFFEISIKNVGVVGKMVVLLYSDYVPSTVKNFLAFCDPKGKFTYKGNLFYLIFQNFYCQTGDVVENRGYGGTSIYGPYFGNEDFTLKHAERGVLTMHSLIPNRNASQFLITFRKLESLDGENVVFGKVIKGFHILDAIESVGTKKTGRPKVEIYISDCDEI